MGYSTINGTIDFSRNICCHLSIFIWIALIYADGYFISPQLSSESVKCLRVICCKQAQIECSFGIPVLQCWHYLDRLLKRPTVHSLLKLIRLNNPHRVMMLKTQENLEFQMNLIYYMNLMCCVR